MPEGHTIHRLARDHRRWFAGYHVRVSSPQGRFVEAAERLDGATLDGVEAYGKHLLYDFGALGFVHVHLGLFGRFFTHRHPAPTPRPTTRMRLAGAERTVDLVGATTCELLTPDERDAVLERLGPDPLRDDADPELAFAALQRRRVGIGRALMDQGVLAGVGNVYRAELLHVFGLHPETPARAVDRDTWLAMWDQLRAWMHEGVRRRRIVTVPDPGRRRRERVHVYRRDACRSCGGPVRRWDLAGRWAYACERCQPRPAAA